MRYADAQGLGSTGSSWMEDRLQNLVTEYMVDDLVVELADADSNDQ
jgi:hypothetical protein